MVSSDPYPKDRRIILNIQCSQHRSSSSSSSSFSPVLVFLLTIYGANFISGCSELFPNHLGTTSRDTTVQEGDPVEVTCTLNNLTFPLDNGVSKEINSTMLLLKYNGTRIQNSKLRIIDDYTIQYRVKRSSLKEHGVYMCYLDIGLPNMKPRAVCATYVTIARAPRVTDNFNLQCTGYDLKNFTCSWDYQDYKVETEYSLSLMVHDSFNYSTCKPRRSVNQCTFSIHDVAPYLISDKQLKFHLDVSNRFGSISRLYEMDHYSKVKLSSISSLKFTSIGSQTVSITWEPPKSIAYDTYLENITEYDIKLYPTERINGESEGYENNVYNLMDRNQIRTSLVKGVFDLNLTQLIPYTNYTLVIHCRLVTDSGESPWSEGFFQSITTEPDVPYLHPKFTPGGFEVISRYQDERNVIIYFNKLTQLDTNGPDFSYVVRVAPLNFPYEPRSTDSTLPSRPVLSTLPMSSKLESSSTPQPLDMVNNARRPLILAASSPSSPSSVPPHASSSKSIRSFSPAYKFSSTPPMSLTSYPSSPPLDPPSIPTLNLASSDIAYVLNIADVEAWAVKIENLSSSIDYEIEILSQNALGFSAEFSRMIVPREQSIEFEIDQVWGIQWNLTAYTFVWSDSPIDKSIYFSIYWCETTDNRHCAKAVHHTVLEKEKRNFVLQTDKRLHGIRFGVSVVDTQTGGSSGIKWASCIESSPIKSTKNRYKKFDLISLGSESIKLGWKLDCQSLEYLVDKFQINYCRTDSGCDAASVTIIDVPKSFSEFIIDYLDPSTVYNFSVHGLTSRGEDLESPALTVETKIDSMSLGITISVIVIGILSILFIVYTLFICSLKKRKNQIELKKAVDNEWIPKMPSRLKGDANILLNPMCHETHNEYENKEYMNAETTLEKLLDKGINSKLRTGNISTNSNLSHNINMNTVEEVPREVQSNVKNINKIILSTISGNQMNDLQEICFNPTLTIPLVPKSPSPSPMSASLPLTPLPLPLPLPPLTSSLPETNSSSLSSSHNSPTSTTSTTIATESTPSENPDEGVEPGLSGEKDCTNKKKKLAKSFSSASTIVSIHGIRPKERKPSFSHGCDSEDSGYSARPSEKNFGSDLHITVDNSANENRETTDESSNLNETKRTSTENPVYVLPSLLSAQGLRAPTFRELYENGQISPSISDLDLSFNDLSVISIEGERTPKKLLNNYRRSSRKKKNKKPKQPQPPKPQAAASNGYVLA